MPSPSLADTSQISAEPEIRGRGRRGRREGKGGGIVGVNQVEFVVKTRLECEGWYRIGLTAGGSEEREPKRITQSHAGKLHALTSYKIAHKRLIKAHQITSILLGNQTQLYQLGEDSGPCTGAFRPLRDSVHFVQRYYDVTVGS